MFVNYDKLKDKEIYNVQYRALSEARKKELKDTYKELKTKENTKLLIDCIKFKLHINKKDKQLFNYKQCDYIGISKLKERNLDIWID